jgi:hypothetical protein
MPKDEKNLPLEDDQKKAIREAGFNGEKLGEKCQELGLDKKNAYPEYQKGKSDAEEQKKPRY